MEYFGRNRAIKSSVPRLACGRFTEKVGILHGGRDGTEQTAVDSEPLTWTELYPSDGL